MLIKLLSNIFWLSKFNGMAWATSLSYVLLIAYIKYDLYDQGLIVG